MAPHRELDMSLCSVFFLQDQWKQYISEIRLQETGRDKYSPVSPSLAMTGKHDIFYVCLNIKTLRFCSMFWMDPFPGIFLDKCCIIPLYFCGGKGNRRYIPCAFFGICVVFFSKIFCWNIFHPIPIHILAFNISKCLYAMWIFTAKNSWCLCLFHSFVEQDQQSKYWVLCSSMLLLEVQLLMLFLFNGCGTFSLEILSLLFRR